MTETDALAGNDELHAFVDGQLDAERTAAVLRHLQRHPDDAVRAAHWHAQRMALRRMRRAAEPGPTPEALTRTVLRTRRSRWNPWSQAVAALLLVAAGAAGTQAWQAARAPGAPGAATLAAAPQFVQDATTAYAVFAPEVRHPVEVTAQEETHLVQWLSRRLGRTLAAPDLQGQGFHLLGGRLLTGEPAAGARTIQAAGGPMQGNPAARAQFMYEDARGRRVTLYVAVFPAGVAPRETAFRSVNTAGGTAFYWVDNDCGYALNGDLPAAELQRLAGGVYDQLFPR